MSYSNASLLTSLDDLLGDTLPRIAGDRVIDAAVQCTVRELRPALVSRCATLHPEVDDVLDLDRFFIGAAHRTPQNQSHEQVTCTLRESPGMRGPCQYIMPSTHPKYL